MFATLDVKNTAPLADILFALNLELRIPKYLMKESKEMDIIAAIVDFFNVLYDELLKTQLPFTAS